MENFTKGRSMTSLEKERQDGTMASYGKKEDGHA